MSLAEKLRNRAAECLKAADEMDDPERKAMMREIAECWLDLAARAETGLSHVVVIDDLKSTSR